MFGSLKPPASLGGRVLQNKQWPPLPDRPCNQQSNRLAACTSRSSVRQSRGCHLSWNEALYRFARRRPQLTRGPAAANLLWMLMVQTSLLVLGCNRIHQGAFSAGHRMRTVPVSASPVVNTRRSIQCFALLVVNTRRSITPAAQLRRRHRGTCQFSLRDLVVQHAGHHPCWKAAHFLPCTRPPDVMRMHRPPKRATYGPSARIAFVSTHSGLQTMPTGGHGDDPAPSAVTGAAAGPVRRFTPIAPPRNLKDGLAPLDDDQYGSKFGP